MRADGMSSYAPLHGFLPEARHGVPQRAVDGPAIIGFECRPRSFFRSTSSVVGLFRQNVRIDRITPSAPKPSGSDGPRREGTAVGLFRQSGEADHRVGSPL